MLTSTRNFLLLALIGLGVALAAGLISSAMAGSSDAGSLLLGAIVAGLALAMFSLVPPALRLLLRGWARVGIGPRNRSTAAWVADVVSIGVWLLWIVGAGAALPPAWGPLLAKLGMG